MSAQQKSECCSASSAAQLSENCSPDSVLACGMLQVWGSGLAEKEKETSKGQTRYWEGGGKNIETICDNLGPKESHVYP